MCFCCCFSIKLLNFSCLFIVFCNLIPKLTPVFLKKKVNFIAFIQEYFNSYLYIGLKFLRF